MVVCIEEKVRAWECGSVISTRGFKLSAFGLKMINFAVQISLI